MTSDFVRLDRIVREQQSLTYEFSTSLNVFEKKKFFIRYDKPLPPARESVDAIPFAAAMMPICLAAGAELRMPVLDDAYARAMEESRDYFKRWFSGRWSLKSRLVTHRIKNESHPQNSGVLFSSGVDSLTTYIRHEDEQPVLYSIFGADIPLSNQPFIDVCKEKFQKFADQQRADIHYISSDVREIFNYDKLRKYSKNWYGEVAHGLLLTSLVAPCSYDTLKKLYIASCYHAPGCNYSCGSDINLMRSIAWGSTYVENDNNGMTRPQKIGTYLKDRENFYEHVRVCWMQFKSYNCSQCEKCLRTMCELLVNNIDPALCNFAIDSYTLPQLKRKILREPYFFFRSENVLDFWRAIQQSVRLNELKDQCQSKDFFTWYAGLDAIRKKQNSFFSKLAGAWIDARARVNHWRVQSLDSKALVSQGAKNAN